MPATPPAQLSFDLPVRPALRREDFLVATANAAAVRWLDRWPDWPGPFLAIHGPPGCGKTHLIHVWAARSGAPVIQGAALTQEYVVGLAKARHVAIDDAEQLSDERALFHLYNIVAEVGGTILMASRLPPSHWAVVLPDLRSRLGAVQCVDVSAPDDALFAAVLVKLFSERQLSVSAEVIDYLVTRLERSFEAARDSVAAIDRLSLAERRAVTVPFLSRILGAVPGGRME